MPSALFWTGMLGGTAEYRCYVPGRALAARGWDISYTEEGFDVSLGGRVAGDPDVLVLSRAMGDYIPDAVRRIRRCGRTKVVYDIDDWFRGVPPFNPASKVPASTVATMHAAMAEADLVTCSTPELAEGYADLNQIAILPNYLQKELWEPWVGSLTRNEIHVGWMGAFHWRAGDLELLKPWLPGFLKDHSEVRFAAIGCRELLEWLGVDGLTTPQLPEHDRVTKLNRNLHPYEHLPAMLANLDLGLVPLARNKFNDAKSWAKGLEYNAAGAPAVASPSREYRDFIRPGINGYLVAKKNWRDAVELALEDLDELKSGALKVANEYWIEDHVDKWVEAYAC